MDKFNNRNIHILKINNMQRNFYNSAVINKC